MASYRTYKVYLGGAMSHHVFKAQAICGSCKGTGIYVGMAENDGAGVVCHTCKGTGCQTLTVEYDDFEGRKRRTDVRRVYQTNPGIGIGVNGADGQRFDLSDFGGLPYDEWVAGAKFTPGTENRLFTCPAWYYQSADYSKKPDWNECLGAGIFASCQYFKTKDQCWARWDKENIVQIKGAV